MTPNFNILSTGIGSLPYLEVEPALDAAFAVDLPYLPTLPQLGPEEGILAQGPGRAWEGFLRRVERAKPSWVKLQGVGPVTLSAARQELEPESFDRQIRESIAQAQARVKALRMLGRKVLFFIDEPSLFQMHPEEPGFHALRLRLQAMAEALHAAGARVGVHCCGPVDFTPLWRLPLDVLSFDAALSLDAFLAGGEGLQAWLDHGGRPALGAVPTAISGAWNCAREVQGCLSGFTAALGEDLGRRVLGESLLTPACGLGLRDVAEAERVMAALQEFKNLMTHSL
jgi:Methionine synthase II (cobalamin-independent)